MSNTISPSKEFNKIREMYEQDSTQETFNLLLCGETGTGKTYLTQTARAPIHIDSFDPGGTKSVRGEIRKGRIIADTRWEKENPGKPQVFQDWVKEYNRRSQGGYFEHIGTYVIDSLTSWQQCLMNHILKKEGRAGGVPNWGKDYMPHKVKTKNFISAILALPCDVIITAHLDSNKDEVSGRMSYRLMATGTNTVDLPNLFDEVWVMDPIEQGDDVNFRILTKATGRYLARSRMNDQGQIDTYELPNIKSILKKANMPTEDLPLPGEYDEAEPA